MCLEIFDHFGPIEEDGSLYRITAQNPFRDPVPYGAFRDFKILSNAADTQQ